MTGWPVSITPLPFSACSLSAPRNELKGPYRASKGMNTSRRSLTRGSSGESPRLVWSGLCSMAPGV